MNRIWILLLFSTLLISCVEDDSPYLQYTSFELGFLYYPYDTLTYIGNYIEYHDSALFLINGKDTINAKVKTTIFDWLDPILSYSQKTLNGTSDLYFPKSCEIKYLSVSMNTKHAQSVGDLYFELGINNKNYNLQIECIDTIKPIQLFVQGFKYDSVFVFNDYDAGPWDDFLQIKYARKYGFISIKVNDSIRVERLMRE